MYEYHSGTMTHRVCCQDTSSIYFGTGGTDQPTIVYNSCYGCPNVPHFSIPDRLCVEEEPEKIVRAKNIRKGLATLPHNRKKMRY